MDFCAIFFVRSQNFELSLSLQLFDYLSIVVNYFKSRLFKEGNIPIIP